MDDRLQVVLRGDSALRRLPPVLWNEEEIQKNLDEMLASYQGRTYTEDEIKNAKADRAAVNKIDKQLADAKKRVVDMYRDPVAEFSAKIDAMRQQTQAISAAIDQQVKHVEDARKADKRVLFEGVYDGMIGDDLRPLIAFDKLLDPKWLNASTTLAPARQELMARIETCRAELDTLRSTCGDDFEAVERVYLNNLSIREAMAEWSHIQQTREAQRRAEEARQAEEAARRAAPIVVPPTDEEREAREQGAVRAQTNQIITEEGRLDFSSLQPKSEAEQPKWYNFGAWLTRDDIAALKLFFAGRDIKYGKAKI